jgi:hypothetical protein
LTFVGFQIESAFLLNSNEATLLQLVKCTISGVPADVKGFGGLADRKSYPSVVVAEVPVL